LLRSDRLRYGCSGVQRGTVRDIPLDFAAQRSISVVRKEEDATMTPHTADAAVKEFLDEIVGRLEQATVAKAADACMIVGHREQAVGFLLDVEQPLYEVNTLLNAASFINRSARG
jgi:hypothetical protein